MTSKKNDQIVDQASKFRIAVLGQSGVGKTAFIVRFVTDKFIGDYDSELEMVYQRMLLTSSTSDLVLFEIVDTAEQKEDNEKVLQEKMKWADAFVLLYSVTDRLSFSNVDRLKFLISYTVRNSQACCNKADSVPPIVVVANKSDSIYERMVTTKEGHDLAVELNCPFFELSVRESVDDVIFVLTSLYEMHKQNDKSGNSRQRQTFGPHFDLPLIGSHHHLFVPVPISKHHKSQKYVEKLTRIQGSSSTLRIQKDGNEANRAVLSSSPKRESALHKTHGSSESNSLVRHHSVIRNSFNSEHSSSSLSGLNGSI